MTHTSAHETIKRQAKRLRDHLGISLTTAKQLLARGLYGCASWSDLSSRLSSNQGRHGPLQLADLPDSPVALAYFAKNLGNLANALSQHVVTDRDLTTLCETLRLVFAVPGEPVKLNDVLPSLRHAGWRPTDVGPDPLAVIQTKLRVNGIDLLLLGTRIFWPRLFEFDSAITIEGAMAEPIGCDLKIMWEVAPWFEASRHYLLEFQRDDNWDMLPELTIPDITATAGMQQHERWFAQCLAFWSQECCYNDQGDEFIPFLYGGHAYLVFGLPCSMPDHQAAGDSQLVSFPYEESNEYQLISLDGQLLHIEHLTRPSPASQQDWEYADYYAALNQELFRNAAISGLKGSPRRDQLLFAAPASQCILEQQMTMDIKPEPNETLFTLRSANPRLAVEVLERVSSGQFAHVEDKWHGPRYSMQLEVPWKDADVGLNLSLHAIDEGMLRSSLLSTIGPFDKAGRRVIHLYIQPELINLVDRHPVRALKQALLDGRVLRGKGLRAALNRQPRRQGQLNEAERADLHETRLIADEAFNDIIAEINSHG